LYGAWSAMRRFDDLYDVSITNSKLTLSRAGVAYASIRGIITTTRWRDHSAHTHRHGAGLHRCCAELRAATEAKHGSIESTHAFHRAAARDRDASKGLNRGAARITRAWHRARRAHERHPAAAFRSIGAARHREASEAAALSGARRGAAFHRSRWRTREGGATAASATAATRIGTAFTSAPTRLRASRALTACVLDAVVITIIATCADSNSMQHQQTDRYVS
jgi:hypothetical protein